MPNKGKNKRARSTRRRGTGPNSQSNPMSGLITDVKMPRPLESRVGRTTTVILRNYATVATDSSGVHTGVIPCDPSATLSSYYGSVTMFPEWANYAALYNEVKLVQLDIRLTTTYTYDGKQAQAEPMIIAGVTSAITAAPSGYAAVADNGDAQFWPCLIDTSGRNRFHAIRFRPSAWATVTTPNPGSSTGISAGCPGGILLYLSSAPVSTQIATVLITGQYLLRTRV